MRSPADLGLFYPALRSAPDTIASPHLSNCFPPRSYDTLYPIYLDVKAPHCAGGRRVPKSLALQWPLAESIAGACGRLGVQTVYEVSHSFQHHPIHRFRAWRHHTPPLVRRALTAYRPLRSR